MEDRFSVNQITSEIYDVPAVSDDIKGIESFIDENKGKKVVVVQGLGFVGAVMSLVCANAVNEEYAVIGVDLATTDSFWKIKSLNEGIFPLVADDPKIKEFFLKCREKGNFYATYDEKAFGYADVIIVDINLDVQKKSSSNAELLGFDVDLSGFRSAITTLARNCKENVLILVETTVPPGTCKKLIKPIIDDVFAERNLSTKSYALGHSYERVMPGPNYIDSIRRYPRVYSGVDEASADQVEQFLETIIETDYCELTRLEDPNATEMAKVLENSYRAMNISFIVEWSRFAEEAGVDLFAVVNAIRDRKTHSNLMYPGIGVGGYCLTKDPLLASWARQNFFGSPEALNMSVQSVSINDQMPVHAYGRLLELVGELRNKNILILGVSYRGDVGDTRFSPVEKLVELLDQSSVKLSLHDPFVSFWKERNCDVGFELSLDELNQFDLVIIATGHSYYKSPEVISFFTSMERTFIFDTIGIFSDNQLHQLRNKHVVSVLGSGIHK